MIDFQNTLIKLIIFDTEGVTLNNYPVIVQYYNFLNQAWTNLYTQTIIKGGIYIQGNIDSPTTEEIPFFDYIRDGQIPPIRIIPAEHIATGTESQQVIASTCAFNFYEDQGYLFEFHFGTLWMVPEEVTTALGANFKGFIPLTSPYPTSRPVTEPDHSPIPINELYTNLVSEIDTATRTSGTSAFKLSNISLKLKAFIQRDGDTVSASLLDLTNSEDANGEAISELTFDITPTPTETGTLATLPDVTGLTETAVRRVLKSLNLRLNPVYQKNLDVVNGDSFKQSPVEGDAIQPNQLITVIFSKHE
nr:PASTA domain-containing protein [uncultured Fluviicola sp.]